MTDSIQKDYTHEKEMDYIKGLSRTGYRANIRQYNGKKALEQYIAVADKRVKWGHIRKLDAVLYAKVLLGRL